jgi:hypothetical protein
VTVHSAAQLTFSLKVLLMSDNALTTLDLSQLPSTQIGSDEAFAELSKGGEFLGYLKLCTNDKYTKRGKILPGHWGIPGPDDTIVDLGDSIDILPLARRPKAIDIADQSAIVVSYDESSPEFKRISDRALEANSGCQFGISFLVLERSTNQFLELFFGNKSARREAKNLYAYLPLTQAEIDRKAAAGANVTGLVPHDAHPVTLKVRLAENKKGQSWHAPVVVKCSVPFAKIPPMATIAREMNKFLSVKSGGVEKVAEPEGRTARAR